MKLSSSQGTGLETNSKSDESLEFGIGNASVVIEILRNRLYSNPIQTLVQEYISNARDAHREAGREETRIEVGLPSSESPIFFVRDFGCGISPERIKEIFVYYGSSTKRHTNSQTGGFGIGAKSAWAYTDNFTIKAVYDGVERHYLAHIGTKNNGVLEKIFESLTDKVNQTTIEIAVKAKDFDLFVNSSLRATMFWDIRPKFICVGQYFEKWVKEVGGHSGPEWYVDLKKENEVGSLDIFSQEKLNDLFRASSYWDSGIVLSVDGIPYYLEPSFKEVYSELKSVVEYEGKVLVFNVQNGDCEVSASREKIADSETSKTGLTKIFSDQVKKIKREVDGRFKKVTSLEEFHSFCKENRRSFTPNFCSKYSFSGWTIRNKKIYSSDDEIKKKQFVLCENYTQRSKTSKTGKRIVLTQSDMSVELGIPTNCVKFYYLDRECSKLEIKERVRSIFPETADGSVVVFLSNSSLTETFSAEAFSSISMPKKKRAAYSSQARSNKLRISVYTGNNRSRKENFNTETVEKGFSASETYVYSIIPFGSSDIPRLYDIARDLSDFGVKFCLVQEKDAAKAKLFNNFVCFDDFKNNFSTHVKDKKLHESVVQKRVYDLISPKLGSDVIEFLKESNREVFSQEMKSSLNFLANFMRGINDIPYGLHFNWVDRLGISGSIQDLDQAISASNKLIKEVEYRYPLLSHLDSIDKRLYNEIEMYIKSKI